LQWDRDLDGLNDAVEMELAEKFMPRFHFHEEEEYFPTSAAHFVNKSSLWYRRSFFGPDCQLAAHGETTGHTLPVFKPSSARSAWGSCGISPMYQRRGLRGAAPIPAVPQTMSAEEQCAQIGLFCLTFEYPLTSQAPVVECHNQLHSESAAFEDNSASTLMRTATDGSQGFFLELGHESVAEASHAGFDNHAPVYVHVFPTKNTMFPESITIQYWLFYPFNGAVVDALGAGAHEGDWEHVTIVVHNKTHVVEGVYLAAHSHDAMWLHAKDVSWTDGHLDVFVALHTHASYEKPGRHELRILFNKSFIYDYASLLGPSWIPQLLINLGEKEFPSEAAPWLRYNGYWGSKRLSYASQLVMPFDTASPPQGPAHQTDYWTLN
jgi:hypothetical protein